MPGANAVDRYRKQGMEYRFHDDASSAVATGGAEVSKDAATGTGAGDDAGTVAHDDSHPTHTPTDAS